MTARSFLTARAALAVTAFVLSGCQADGRAAAAAGSVTRPASSPRAAIDHFLQFYFHEYGSGLPTEDERVVLSAMVTREFAAALEAVARAEACAYGEHGGTEPPLIEGDLFSSLFEKANGVLGTTEVSNDGQAAQYTLHFEYRTPGNTGEVSKWQDDVQLVRIDGAWLIDDFVHRGDWQFSSPGSVKFMLTEMSGLCAER
jgi:hypothetical protein